MANLRRSLQVHPHRSDQRQRQNQHQPDLDRMLLHPTRPARPPMSLVRLPTELLALVFEQYHLMDQPIPPLMLVCQRFYHIIRRLPRLWRRILVSADVMPSSLKKGSTMACSDLKFLTKCVQLAANAPLETTFVIGQLPDDEPPSPATRAARYELVLKKSSRISFLCIIINPGVPLDLVVQSFAHLFTSSTCFESLESLMIASAVLVPGLLSAFANLFIQIEKSSTKLASLYFENVGNEFIVATRQHAFWRRLRRITLKGEHTPLPSTAFEGCSNLEFCSFSGELLVTPKLATSPHGSHSLNARGPFPLLPVPHSNGSHDGSKTGNPDPDHIVSLDNIKWLRLGAMRTSALRHLSLQNLRFLVIQSVLRECATSSKDEGHRQRSQDTAHEPYSLLLPNLETLHVGTTHSQVNSLRLPKLHTLHLQIQSLQRVSASSILTEIFPSNPPNANVWRPKSLDLNASVHDKALVAMINTIGSTLESMTLTVDKLSRRLLVALQRKGSLPNLLRLTLELSTLSVDSNSNSADVTTKMSDLAQSRKRQGVEFAWLSWKKSPGASSSPERISTAEESRRETIVVNNDICASCRAQPNQRKEGRRNRTDAVITR